MKVSQGWGSSEVLSYVNAPGVSYLDEDGKVLLVPKWAALGPWLLKLEINAMKPIQPGILNHQVNENRTIASCSHHGSEPREGMVLTGPQMPSPLSPSFLLPYGFRLAQDPINVIGTITSPSSWCLEIQLQLQHPLLVVGCINNTPTEPIESSQ